MSSVASKLLAAAAGSSVEAIDDDWDSVVLLLDGDGTNGSTTFTDRKGIHSQTAVGNTQVSTSTKKYGTGSIAFDGDGDELLVAATSSYLTFGTGNFTIETWAYFNSLGGLKVLFDWRDASGPQGGYITLYFSGSTLYLYDGSGNVVNSGSLSTGQWYHIALTRNSGTTRMFVDGTLKTSASNSTNYQSPQNGYLTIAGLNTDFPLSCYLDDIRLTKGVARYTANFTPPTQAHPTSGS